MPSTPMRIVRRLRSPPVWIALSYAIVAMGWILLSDRMLEALVGGQASWVEWSVYKGLAFVAVTSVFLFGLMRRTYGAMERAVNALRAREKKIQRLSRLNTALSHINQAIVRLPVREELFRRVCEILVREGGFRIAWIAWHNGVTDQLEPLAVADELGKGEAAVVQEVTERVFRENQPHVCNDLREDFPLLANKDGLRRRGLRAFLALPIRSGDRTGGVLHVYADDPDIFETQEAALLTEATCDVALALDNLAREEERHHAESTAVNERNFSDTMIESMPGVLYFYDMSGQFLRWNRNFERISGYTGAEIATMHPLQFFAEDDRPEVARRINDVFAHGESSVEAPFLAKDGRATPYFFTGRSVELEGRACLVGVGIDISPRKEAEAALRELNASLEHKVAKRTEELHALLVRAEAADRIKSAFLATMSHELRTPLNSIIGFTGIVLQGLAGPLNAEQTKQLGMVRGSARHLLELINDVLDLSKIEAGQLEVRAEAFDLNASIERVVASVKPLAERKGLGIVVCVPPAQSVGTTMTGDRRRVEQVLLNLLNNAIKFTDHGTVSLHVDVVADEKAEKRVRLLVRDTGIGIKPPDMSSLFQPFRQVDSGLSRQHEGTGLGLAICRRLVTLMGGEITVASEWSRGSEFTVLLPLKLRLPL